MIDPSVRVLSLLLTRRGAVRVVLAMRISRKRRGSWQTPTDELKLLRRVKWMELLAREESMVLAALAVASRCAPWSSIAAMRSVT
jgi:hypothetical protein